MGTCALRVLGLKTPLRDPEGYYTGVHGGLKGAEYQSFGHFSFTLVAQGYFFGGWFQNTFSGAFWTLPGEKRSKESLKSLLKFVCNMRAFILRIGVGAHYGVP